MTAAQCIRRFAGGFATIGLLTALVLLSSATGGLPSDALAVSAPPDTQKAQSTGAPITVAAVFANATTTSHFCTASVVDSPHGDVLITAAHCVRGSAKGWSVAPGYRDGVSPYGRWRVTGVYLDPGWIKDQDARRDYAFLTVAPRRVNGRTRSIQSVVGGERLGSVPRSGVKVTVSGYPDGSDNQAVTCSAKVYFKGIFPAFDCEPYVDGTSGSPWLVKLKDGGSEVVGVIGGLNQGGCYEWTSYSSLLDKHARAVYARAASGAKTDVAPSAGSDGCTTGL